MKILLATDLSDEAGVAARWAFQAARRLRAQKVDVTLDVLHVTEPPRVQIAGAKAIYEDPDNRLRLEDAVRRWLEAAVETDLPYTISFVEGSPPRRIQEYARDQQVDWLVVGMTGRGAFARAMVGSTAHKIAHDPPCNLVVAHPEHAVWTETPKFLVAVDFSEHSKRAVDVAIQQSRLWKAELHLVNVVLPPRPIALPDGMVSYTGGELQDLTTIENQARKDLDGLVSEKSASLQGLSYEHRVLTGYPTREILEYAQVEGIDGIFLGTVGRTALDEFFLGSVAHGVVKRMPCTIILTPPVRETEAS